MKIVIYMCLLVEGTIRVFTEQNIIQQNDSWVRNIYINRNLDKELMIMLIKQNRQILEII